MAGFDLVGAVAEYFLGPVLARIRRWILRPECLKHDRLLFRRANIILDERTLIDTLDEIANLHQHRGSFLSQLETFCRVFEELGTQFLERRLRRAADDLCTSLRQLTGFIGVNFFTLKQTISLGPNEMRFGFHPEKRHEEKWRAFYNGKAVELEILADEVSKKYSRYRTLAKDCLLE